MKEDIKIVRVNTMELIFENREMLTEIFEQSAQINFGNTREQNGDVWYRKLLTYFLKDSAIVYFSYYKDVLCGILWFFEISSKRIHLNEIAIHENYRRKGIGEELIKTMERYAKENSIYEIELYCMQKNNIANDFYSRLGFESEKRLLVKRNYGDSK